MNNKSNWIQAIHHNPLPLLSSSTAPAISIYTNQLIQSSSQDPKNHLWNLPVILKLVKNQENDGHWRFLGNRPGDAYGEKYELFETWKVLRNLVEKYGFDKRHTVVGKAIDYIFSHQTDEGDIRGILSYQYTPYYMGAMMEIAIKAGFFEDDRVQKGFKWL